MTHPPPDELATYPTKHTYLLHLRAMIDAFEQGVMEESDFRNRLAAMSVCRISDDTPAP